jgi:hypothetical protein
VRITHQLGTNLGLEEDAVKIIPVPAIFAVGEMQSVAAAAKGGEDKRITRMKRRGETGGEDESAEEMEVAVHGVDERAAAWGVQLERRRTPGLCRSLECCDLSQLFRLGDLSPKQHRAQRCDANTVAHAPQGGDVLLDTNASGCWRRQVALPEKR